jgi:hypothetical protein
MTYKESLICAVTQGLMGQYRLHDDKAPEMLAKDVKKFVDAILSEMPESSEQKFTYHNGTYPLPTFVE